MYELSNMCTSIEVCTLKIFLSLRETRVVRRTRGGNANLESLAF